MVDPDDTPRDASYILLDIAMHAMAYVNALDEFHPLDEIVFTPVHQLETQLAGSAYYLCQLLQELEECLAHFGHAIISIMPSSVLRDIRRIGVIVECQLDRWKWAEIVKPYGKAWIAARKLKCPGSPQMRLFALPDK